MNHLNLCNGDLEQALAVSASRFQITGDLRCATLSTCGLGLGTKRNKSEAAGMCKRWQGCDPLPHVCSRLLECIGYHINGGHYSGQYHGPTMSKGF